jgi:hypothetical protein
MPYTNIPRRLWPKMERCTKRVGADGNDKAASIAICYTSIMSKRKEAAHRRMASGITSTKAPKYDARAGQVIAGNLARGGDGKFTRADGSAASGREVVTALTKKPKAGKRGAAKVTDAQVDATAQKVGLQAGDAKTLASFAKGGQMDDATASRLEKAGMVERGKDGALRFTGAGRSATRALQRGDERGAADAVSRARDTQSKREEAQAKREQAAAVRAERATQRAGTRQSRENTRANADAKRNNEEKAKVVNRLEEIETLANQRGDTMTPLQRTQSINRLEELATRLEKAGGDEATAKRIETLRRQLTGEDAPVEPPANVTPIKEVKASSSSFEVFKAGDAYRWLAVTTNAYKDGDGEIVSTEALEADAERMSESGEFGPLRWWHVGRVEYPRPLDWTSAKAGKGIDIGTADYAAVLGRMRIEGGTIAKEYAEAVMQNPQDYQLSIGFAHPISEPAAGVFKQIRTFERSLLPRGKAANPFTSIQIQQESDMASMQEKVKSLADRFFGGDVAKAEALASEVIAQSKEIEGAGVAFKAEGETAKAEESKATEVKAEEVKADAEMDMAEGETPEADDTGDGAPFVGDMTPDEFAQLIAGAIAKAIAPLMGQMNEATAAAQAVQKELSTTKEASGKAIVALDQRVKELEGDAPGAKGFRASQAKETLKESPPAQPASEDDIARLASWLVQPAQAA